MARWSKAGGIGYLIGAAWTEGEAQERGVVVSDQDAREAMEPPHDGLTREDRIYEARIALLNAAIKQPISQNAALGVTPPQIDAYVASHPKFGPERRSVYVMRLKNRQTARKALRSLRRGLSLRSASKRYANGNTGLIFAEPGELDPKPFGRKIFTVQTRRLFPLRDLRLQGADDRGAAAAAAQRAERPGVRGARKRSPATGDRQPTRPRSRPSGARARPVQTPRARRTSAATPQRASSAPTASTAPRTRTSAEPRAAAVVDPHPASYRRPPHHLPGGSKARGRIRGADV